MRESKKEVSNYINNEDVVEKIVKSILCSQKKEGRIRSGAVDLEQNRINETVIASLKAESPHNSRQSCLSNRHNALSAPFYDDD